MTCLQLGVEVERLQAVQAAVEVGADRAARPSDSSSSRKCSSSRIVSLQSAIDASRHASCTGRSFDRRHVGGDQPTRSA